MPEATQKLAPPPRIAALDAARALGVLAMVFGHTLDALLAPAVRETPAAIAYWKARGLTAPVFLMVSGWAVTVAILRGRASGVAIPRGRLRRVLLLLGIGYALRFPGWDVGGLAAGSTEAWGHLLAFDALHAIAAALLAASCVLALPWTGREKAAAFGLLAVLAVSLGMRAPGAPATFLPVLALQQAAGGSSPFPMFPWTAYFFAGAIVGLLAGDGRGARALALAGIGGVLVLATFWTGVGTMPPAHPALVLFRVGVILCLLAALSLVPAAAGRAVAPLGRASLGVYAIHVPLVYGWSTWAGLSRRIGPHLGVGEALLVAAAVLASSFAAHRLVAAVRAGAAAGLGQLASASTRNETARRSAQ